LVLCSLTLYYAGGARDVQPPRLNSCAAARFLNPGVPGPPAKQ